MNGPGDIGGEVSGEEAAWRDLVARYDLPADVDPAGAPWPDRENLSRAGSSQAGTSGYDPPEFGLSEAGTSAPSRPGTSSSGPAPPAAGPPRDQDRPAPHVIEGYPAADRTRIIRQAGDPRDYSPPEEPADEAYVPAPLPPPAKLDPMAKAAWAGLIGGPAYLLIGVLVGWTISGIAAFAAIAAFIAGFVILVLRLGDGAKRDDDDDGAVL